MLFVMWFFGLLVAGIVLVKLTQVVSLACCHVLRFVSNEVRDRRGKIVLGAVHLAGGAYFGAYPPMRSPSFGDHLRFVGGGIVLTALFGFAIYACIGMLACLNRDFVDLATTDHP